MVKRRLLNRERVVARAIEMADAAGDVKGITMTALASALDIRVPSLYNHIKNLEDLRSAMAEAAARDLIDRLRSAAAGKIGREALLAMAFAYRQYSQDHPGIYPLTISAPEPGEERMVALAQELLQILLLVLGSMGISGEQALHVVRGIRSILHGFTSLEVAGGFKMDLDREESLRRLVEAYLNGVLEKS
jgi:AcrR family transcriptional regulator